MTLFKHGWHDVFFPLLFPRPRSPRALQCSGPVLGEAAGVRLVLGRWSGVHGYVHDGWWAGPLLYGNSCWSGTLRKVRSKLGNSSAPWGSICPSSTASIYSWLVFHKHFPAFPNRTVWVIILVFCSINIHLRLLLWLILEHVSPLTDRDVLIVHLIINWILRAHIVGLAHSRRDVL